MCTSPIKIKNRSKDPYANPYLFVPCGKCLACQKSKSDGIEYRAIKEYDWCLSHGGRAYMITFTYDDEHLPRARAFKATNRVGNKFVGIDYGEYNSLRTLKEQYPELSDIKLPYPEYKDFYCHNKRDIQLFNKKLRARLKYYGYDVTISYFIASEFGSDRYYTDSKGKRRKATERPHYHGIYFLYPNGSSNIPSEHTFLNFAYDCWRMCSSKNFKNLLIDNKITSAIGYVAKYVVKSESYECFGKRLFDVPCTFALFSGDDLQLVEESQIAPFTLISKNFGSKHLLNKSVASLAIELSKNVSIVNPNGKPYQFPCPTYYKQKFLYNTTPVTRDIIETYPVPVVQELPDNVYTEVIYLTEHSTEKSSQTDKCIEYIPQWISTQKHSFDKMYSSLCVSWYDAKDKPFSEEFLKYGLYDFLLTRYAYVDIFSGEMIEPENTIFSYPDGNRKCFLSDYVIKKFFSVASAKEHDKIRYSIESFIDSYNRTQSKFRNDKLLILKDKAKKRAAERKFLNQNVCANETTLKTLIRSHEIRMRNCLFNSKT